MNQVVALPIQTVKAIKPDVKFAVISIAAEPSGWPDIKDSLCMGTLQLIFYDLDFYEKEMDYYLFSREKARQIIEFVGNNFSDIELLIVHCQLGISRSPAVAAAISKFYFKDDTAWFRPPYVPNMYVYSTLLKEFHNLDAKKD